MKLPPFRHSWLLALCLLTFLPLHAWAANYVVTDTTDNGYADNGTADPGSLRNAIDLANANPDSTITFDPTVFAAMQTITLQGGADLQINEPTTITGPAAGVAITWANNEVLTDYGTFDVECGSTSNPVVLNGLTIEDNVNSVRGGGVYVDDGDTLQLNNCTFTGNAASLGGAVDNAGAAILNNCVITGNEAVGGGGIYNTGTINVANCVIAGNTVTDAGMIDCVRGTVTLANCTIAGNHSNYSCPGISVYGGTATVANCIFAQDTSGEGFPEAFANGGSLTVSYSDIDGGYPGTDNINEDPDFVSDPGSFGSGDYGDLALQSGSPCIAAGATQTEADELDLGVTIPVTDITELVRPSPPSIGAYDYAADGSVSTATTVASSLNPSAPGQSVTFTATVDQGATAYPASGGTFTFNVDGTQTAEPVGANGQASITTTFPAAGSDSVSAAYSGAGPYEGSNSATITQSVVSFSFNVPVTAGIGVPTPITVSANPSTYNGPVTITSSDSAATGLPTGPVTLTNGTATFDVTFNTLGDQTVTATDDGTTPDTSITGTSSSIDVVAGPTANPQTLSNVFLLAPICLSGSDPQGEKLTYQIASNPSHGYILFFDPKHGTLIYLQDFFYFGPDSFTFTVTDTSGLTSAPATVSINPPKPPTAGAQSVSVQSGSSIKVNLCACDPQGEQVTYAIAAGPAHGTIASFNANTGTLVYTPNSGYTGTDSFTFTATDTSDLTSSPATVSVDVTAKRGRG